MERKKIAIYACGGCGINLGSVFLRYEGQEDSGFAQINSYFIDTSKSNIIHSKVPEDKLYLVDGLDGSGKRRETNYQALAENSKRIIHQFKPGDINIVLHSASGGSGSVMGPILVSELLDRKLPTIVVLVGGTSSRIETDNTIKTLKSYEMISRKRNSPVIAAYRENSPTKNRGDVDSEIQTIVMVTAALFSGQNRELDASDLKNFLNYNSVTSYTPKLTFFDFFAKDIILNKEESLISLVTLVDTETPSDVHIPVEYQAVGFLPESTKQAIGVSLPIHACTISGFFIKVVERLEDKLGDFDAARQVAVEKPIVGHDADHTSEGLIF